MLSGAMPRYRFRSAEAWLIEIPKAAIRSLRLTWPSQKSRNSMNSSRRSIPHRTVPCVAPTFAPQYRDPQQNCIRLVTGRFVKRGGLWQGARREGEGGGAVSGAWYFSWYLALIAFVTH